MRDQRDRDWLVAVWRVGAPSFQVDSFVRRFRLKPDEVFHAGGKRGRKRVTKISGFNLTVADAESLAELHTQVSRFVDQLRKPILAVKRLKVGSSLDIGFTVGGNRYAFARSVRFPSYLLREMASLNLELEISAYSSQKD